MKEKLNILFVDDEERVLRSLKALFKRNYKVHTATDGHKALEMLKNNPMHVIISDQRMPEMTGVELLTQVKEISPNTIRLLLTGYADLSAIVGSCNNGEILRYINKPWNNDYIQRTIAQAADMGLEKFQVSTPTPVVVESEKEAFSVLVFEEENSTYEALIKIADKKDTIKKATTHNGLFDIIKYHEEIAVIFFELRGENKQDIDSLEMIKQSRPEIIIIALTKFLDANFLIELINQGHIFRFFSLPIDKSILERALKAAKQRFIVNTHP